MPEPVIVFALYKPHPGNETELRSVVARHCPALQKCGLITGRAPVICQSKDGTIIEVFEWVDDDAHNRVREHPEIASIWEQMGKLGSMPVLSSLPEAAQTFPHFKPLNL